MSRTIIGFHVRGIARHAKGLVKHLLGMDRVSEEDLARSTAAWHQPPDPSHPIELCKCVCGPDAPDDQHSDECPWVAARCKTCEGNGHCPKCFGDGTKGDDPAPAKSEPEEWEHA